MSNLEIVLKSVKNKFFLQLQLGHWVWWCESVAHLDWVHLVLGHACPRLTWLTRITKQENLQISKANQIKIEQDGLY